MKFVVSHSTWINYTQYTQMKLNSYSILGLALVATLFGIPSPKLAAQIYYSTFGSPVSGTHYSTSFTGICIGCSSSNPSYAATSSMTDSARMYMTAGALNTMSIKLKLTDTAASVAGVMIGSNTGLINVTALGAITIQTYYAGTLQETFNGISALSLAAVGSTKQKISVNVSKKFNEVRFEVDNSLSALWDINVFYAYGMTIIPLPVKPLTLSASPEDNLTVKVSWTSDDPLASDFTIHFSKDGKSFSPLATVSSYSPAALANTYEYLHRPEMEGVCYYYIEQRNVDDTRYMSPIIATNLHVPNTYIKPETYPNPVTNNLNLKLYSPVSMIELYTYSGELLGQWTTDNSLMQTIPALHLAAGYYLLKLQDDTGTPVYVRFAKQ